MRGMMVTIETPKRAIRGMVAHVKDRDDGVVLYIVLKNGQSIEPVKISDADLWRGTIVITMDYLLHFAGGSGAP